ncbi:MAG: class I SAM-dependent methyltransferase [Parvibaculum sp.]|nr:class I SAM-dependent methyltransferase [Parvibaculum sp.]
MTNPSEGTTAAPLEVLPRNCPSCNAPPEAGRLLSYGSSAWPMRECACGFTYLDKAPVYAELSSNLAWEKSFKQESERRLREHRVSQKLSKSTRWRMRLFKRLNMPELIAASCDSGDVLDIGCATGGHLMKLPEGLRPFGIEISQALGEAAAAALAQRGGTAYIGPALDTMKKLETNRFSAIAMRSYLEHEALPSPVLEEAFRILKPGGVVFVKVPNYNSVNRRIRGRAWCGFRLPDHLNYFTPATLTQMATSKGFSIEKPFMWCLPTSDNMWVRLIKKPDAAAAAA